MRIITLLILFCSITFSQSNELDSFIIKHSNSEELKQAQWAVTVKDVESGETLYDYNGNKALAPASGLKLFTTSTALNYLGAEFQFSTKLYYSGKIIDNVLKGNLIIQGGGDPTLGSSVFKGSLNLEKLMNRWVTIIKKLGIKHIDGQVIADDNLFDKIPVSGYWYWIDLGNYYAAQTSALTINDNLFHLFFKPNKLVGEPAQFLRTEPSIKGVYFINEMKTGAYGSGDNGYVFRSPYDSIAYLRGTIPQGYKEFAIKGSLPDPPLFAADKLTQSLIDKGVEVKGKPAKASESLNYSALSLIDEVKSKPLRDIVRRINKKSDNLYTSQILKMTGLIKYGKGSREAGIKAIFEFLSENNIDTSALSLFDGNGLSRSNTITTEMMTDLLTAVNKKSYFKDFYNSLSIAGNSKDDGTFRSFGKGTILENNARIKSGYITGVRSHSGYLRTRSGKFIAFSIIANNFNCEVREINKIHKNLLILIAQEF